MQAVLSTCGARWDLEAVAGLAVQLTGVMPSGVWR